MHILSVASVFVVIALVGIEFSVAAFVDPAAWRLDPLPQLTLLSRLALVLGRVMPALYPLCTLLFILQTWLHRHSSGFAILLTATLLWTLAALASIIFLVPLNSRIARHDADWQRLHRLWDARHRIRTVVLAVAALLLTTILVP